MKDTFTDRVWETSQRSFLQTVLPSSRTTPGEAPPRFAGAASPAPGLHLVQFVTFTGHHRSSHSQTITVTTYTAHSPWARRRAKSFVCVWDSLSSSQQPSELDTIVTPILLIVPCVYLPKSASKKCADLGCKHSSSRLQNSCLSL